MTIETKFSMGDTVYFMGGIPTKVLSSVIIGINIYVTGKNTSISYHTGLDKVPSMAAYGIIARPESLLFATKKELIDSL